MRGIRTTAMTMAILTAAALTGTAKAGDWTWDITPYFWATNLSMDVTVNDQQIASTDIDFDDLLDATEVTGQLHFEGRTGKHGFLVDGFYVDLHEDGKSVPIPGVPNATALASGDVKLGIYEAAGTFTPRGDGTGFGFLYGARLFDRDLDLDAAFEVAPGTTVTKSYAFGDTLVDGLLGVRYTGRAGKHFGYEARADASSGGTKFSWGASASVGYTFDAAGHYTVLAGYKHLRVEFEKDDVPAEVDVDATLTGFTAGMRFSF